MGFRAGWSEGRPVKVRNEVCSRGFFSERGGLGVEWDLVLMRWSGDFCDADNGAHGLCLKYVLWLIMRG